MSKYYYDIEDDLKAYPNCWLYVIIGGRNTGKTYSTLWTAKRDNINFAFLKRTKVDVEVLCNTGKGSVEMDLSPFKSINRDKGCNVKAITIDAKLGIGGFYNCSDEGEPAGLPIGYIVPLAAAKSIKGFDMSDADWMIFDEFIPQPWERISRKEGEQIMDVYKTILRDREHRGREPLKLIALANATDISNPLMNVVEITDTVAEMLAKGEEFYHDEDRGILIHVIKNSEAFDTAEHNTQMYKAMGDTAWGRMAFGNEFAYNDFSNVKNVSLKGFTPVCCFIYKRKPAYVYQKDGKYHVCKSQFQSKKVYDLAKENDQKAFFYDHIIDIRNACIDGNVTFSTYTYYDLIINYKEFFKL